MAGTTLPKPGDKENSAFDPTSAAILALDLGTRTGFALRGTTGPSPAAP